MEMLQQLQAMFAAYDEKASQVKKNTKGIGGVWGMGEDPRNHPCHEEFYYQVEQWVKEFLAAQPDRAVVAAVAKFLIGAAAERRDQDSFWFSYAAQAHVMPMISWLEPAVCKELVTYYDSLYTKLERLPVQRNLYKKLVKAGKGK